MIKSHCRKAGITKRFSLHGFRTYFITNCLRQGLTFDQIVKWTGHSNTATLGRYDKRVPLDVEKKIMEVEL